jgi:ssDNA-binding Zn-finger/Zn-ribbon topoisomerase 1
MEQGKKMYAITCNDIGKLSGYFISRTGRFHYHIRFEYPTPDEVEVYLKDKLDSEEHHIEIPKIVNFSLKTNLNYDSLRAIAFEINSGETFESAIKDLNIMKSDREVWEVVLTCNNGKSYRDNKYLDLFSDERIHADFSVNKTYIEVSFDADDVIMNNITGVGFLDINNDDVVIEWDTSDKDYVKNMKGIEFVGLSVVKKNTQDRYKYTV